MELAPVVTGRWRDTGGLSKVSVTYNKYASDLMVVLKYINQRQVANFCVSLCYLEQQSEHGRKS